MQPVANPNTHANVQPVHPAADRVRIVSTPGICGGRPRIDGHRITVEDVAIWRERMGMSPDEIVSAYPSITLSDVHAALAYYYENRDRIDADIRDGERFVAELKAKSPSSLIQKNFSRERPMPRTIRFHLDENCHRAVSEGLRRRGIDVTTTPEADLLSAADEEQLAHCVTNDRVLFTQDRDFLRLDAAGTSHPGIANCGKDTKSLGDIIQGLVMIWELLEPEEMRDQVEYL